MKKRGASSNSALSLVEVAMALGIAAFAIVVLVGLLPTGLTSSREAVDEQAATDILLEIENDIRATSPAQTTTPRLQLAMPSAAESTTTSVFSPLGVPSAGAGADGYFRARISRRTASNPALQAWHVVVEWPAMAQNPQGWVEAVVVQPNPGAL
jgi:uncharacterized protein (TIGR02598 family)